MASAVVSCVQGMNIDDSKPGYCEYHRFHGVNFPAKNMPTGILYPRGNESKICNFAITMRPKNIANLGETAKFLMEQASRCHAMMEPKVYPDPCNGCVHAFYHLPPTQKMTISQLVGKLSTGYAMLNMCEKDPIFYISTLRNSKNRKKFLQARDEIAHQVAYDKVIFTRANSAKKGWPALFAIIYNLWLKFDFDRNKFPSMFHPLHIYLVGDSRIGKSQIVSDMVTKGRKNMAKMAFPGSSSSAFKWSLIDVENAPKILHYENFQQRRRDMSDLLK
jgi:hypothetical protein